MKRLLVAAILTLAAASPAFGQIEAMEGSWLLVPEKSIGPAPNWEMLVYDISEGEQRYTMDAVNANGERSHTEWAIAYDGLDHPTLSGRPNTTASIRQISENSEFVTNKRDGVVTSTYTRVLVDDGQTIMSIGRDAEGTIQWVRVFEKQ